MGVRLYPNTKNEEALEKLACVPPGTAKAHAELRLKHRIDQVDLDFFERERRYGEYHNALRVTGDHDSNGNRYVAIYDAFLVFGWGKFKGFGVKGTSNYAGEAKDRYDVAKLLLGNDIITADRLDEWVELCQGVHWS